MATIAAASLTAQERRVVDRLIDRLAAEFGDDLHAVWLFGSRARGDALHEDSDIDLMIVTSRPREVHRRGDWSASCS